MPHCPSTEPRLYQVGNALARCLLHEGRPAPEPADSVEEAIR
jgi:hypothetical protein